MKSLIKMSILSLLVCLSLNGKALADSYAPLSCNEVNYKSYIWSSEKTQKLIAENGVSCNFREVHLYWANLTEADLTRVETGANLYRADITRAYLRRANLIWADLTGADLSGANLTGADFRGADLTGADLSGADLTGADLSGADLTGADLSGADLIGADLREADLRGADLRGADLTHWLWKNTDLKSARYDDKTQFPEDFDPVESGMKKASEGDSGDN